MAHQTVQEQISTGIISRYEKEMSIIQSMVLDNIVGGTTGIVLLGSQQS